MADRLYTVTIEKVERVVLEVRAPNKRAARAVGEAFKTDPHPPGLVENWGWDGMHSYFGRIVSVERDEVPRPTPTATQERQSDASTQERL